MFPPETDTLLITSELVVELLAIVTVDVALGVPAGKLISNGLGEIETAPGPAPPPPATNSTAPMSIGDPLPLSGRGLPKKSVDGANE